MSPSSAPSCGSDSGCSTLNRTGAFCIPGCASGEVNCTQEQLIFLDECTCGASALVLNSILTECNGYTQGVQCRSDSGLALGVSGSSESLLRDDDDETCDLIAQTLNELVVAETGGNAGTEPAVLECSVQNLFQCVPSDDGAESCTRTTQLLSIIAQRRFCATNTPLCLTESPTAQPTFIPTSSPTTSPTVSPTRSPTESDRVLSVSVHCASLLVAPHLCTSSSVTVGFIGPN